MGAHRLDRTGWRGASLVALALLAACSGGGGVKAGVEAMPEA
ncbi:MAG TPA: hypothetical protein VGX28_08460 [Frankiaceae bacterium]|jgi:hypothetical protein|nr:hypothetical protein [Frankiaceae bacterium]